MRILFTLTKNENARRDLNHIREKLFRALGNTDARLFFYHIFRQSAGVHHAGNRL